MGRRSPSIIPAVVFRNTTGRLIRSFVNNRGSFTKELGTERLYSTWSPKVKNIVKSLQSPPSPNNQNNSSAPPPTGPDDVAVSISQIVVPITDQMIKTGQFSSKVIIEIFTLLIEILKIIVKFGVQWGPTVVATILEAVKISFAALSKLMVAIAGAIFTQVSNTIIRGTPLVVNAAQKTIKSLIEQFEALMKISTTLLSATAEFAKVQGPVMGAAVQQGVQRAINSIVEGIAATVNKSNEVWRVCSPIIASFGVQFGNTITASGKKLAEISAAMAGYASSTSIALLNTTTSAITSAATFVRTKTPMVVETFKNAASVGKAGGVLTLEIAKALASRIQSLIETARSPEVQEELARLMDALQEIAVSMGTAAVEAVRYTADQSVKNICAASAATSELAINLYNAAAAAGFALKRNAPGYAATIKTNLLVIYNKIPNVKTISNKLKNIKSSVVSKVKLMRNKWVAYRNAKERSAFLNTATPRELALLLLSNNLSNRNLVLNRWRNKKGSANNATLALVMNRNFGGRNILASRVAVYGPNQLSQLERNLVANNIPRGTINNIIRMNPNTVSRQLAANKAAANRAAANKVANNTTAVNKGAPPNMFATILASINKERAKLVSPNKVVPNKVSPNRAALNKAARNKTTWISEAKSTRAREEMARINTEAPQMIKNLFRNTNDKIKNFKERYKLLAKSQGYTKTKLLNLIEELKMYKKSMKKMTSWTHVGSNLNKTVQNQLEDIDDLIKYTYKLIEQQNRIKAYETERAAKMLKAREEKMAANAAKKVANNQKALGNFFAQFLAQQKLPIGRRMNRSKGG